MVTSAGNAMVARQKSSMRFADDRLNLDSA